MGCILENKQNTNNKMFETVAKTKASVHLKLTAFHQFQLSDDHTFATTATHEAQDKGCDSSFA